MPDRFAILLDGGFVKKKLKEVSHRDPSAAEMVALSKRLVRAVVLVTGDSDLVPAMKFARREGVRVHLDVMGHAVRRELRVHADEVL